MPTYRKSENFAPLRKNTSKNIKSARKSGHTTMGHTHTLRNSSGSAKVVFKKAAKPNTGKK